jgi:ribosomal protein S18 acetylase RimI-like enzyme
VAELTIEETNDLPAVVELFNKIFRPTRTLEQFERRFLGRHQILMLIARDNGEAVGFFVGFELKPDTFFAWFYGVVPEDRRKGVASQLMEAAHRWVSEKKYATIRLECYNQQRPMLHLAIALGYDIVGIRWDASRSSNLVLFEKKFTS